MENHPKRRGRTPPLVKMPKGIKASTSDRPGETKQITFYQLEARQREEGQTDTTTSQNKKKQKKQSLWLADLPGYGFAYASEEVHETMRQLVQTYLLQRGKILKRFLLLLDARHGMKKADIEFLQGLEQEFYTQSRKGLPKKAFPPVQLVSRNKNEYLLVLFDGDISFQYDSKAVFHSFLFVGFNEMRSGRPNRSGPSSFS